MAEVNATVHADITINFYKGGEVVRTKKVNCDNFKFKFDFFFLNRCDEIGVKFQSDTPTDPKFDDNATITIYYYYKDYDWISRRAVVSRRDCYFFEKRERIIDVTKFSAAYIGVDFRPVICGLKFQDPENDSTSEDQYSTDDDYGSPETDDDFGSPETDDDSPNETGDSDDETSSKEEAKEGASPKKTSSKEETDEGVSARKRLRFSSE